MKIKCKCGYEWETRVENPKVCPRCKRRLDTPYQTKIKGEEQNGRKKS